MQQAHPQWDFVVAVLGCGVVMLLRFLYNGGALIEG